MKKIPYEIILIIEVIGSIFLAISFYLYYKSIPEAVPVTGELLKQFEDTYYLIDGCPRTIFGMLEDWFYQGIKFSKHNSCKAPPSFISHNFAYIFWLGWIGEIIGSYLHIRYIFRKK
tara:strand:- start:242 stop:592 length:351 start_codon:yes stop_codon:yes gene_type:complete